MANYFASPLFYYSHFITYADDNYYILSLLPQLLVNVFGKQLQEDKHPHLRNFYVIIPPLIINYVEHMIAAKEKISKNNFNGAAFTDDGLPMGKLKSYDIFLKTRFRATSGGPLLALRD